MAAELDPATLARLARWMDEHNLPGAAHPLHAKLLTGGQANLV
jgi:hypothetical protein